MSAHQNKKCQICTDSMIGIHCVDHADSPDDENDAVDGVEEDIVDMLKQVESSGGDVVDAVCSILQKWPLRFGKKLLPSTTPEDVMDKHQKRVVFVQVYFQKISDIDTAKETFWASVIVRSKWREGKLDRNQGIQDIHKKLSDYWNPRLHFRNYVGNQQKEVVVSYELNYKENEAYVIEQRQLSGTFTEKLELQEFPFDIQTFTVTLQSNRAVCEVELIKEVMDNTELDAKSFLRKQEWRIYSNISYSDRDKDDDVDCNFTNHVKHPVLLATCTASRRSGFYVWNYMLVMLTFTDREVKLMAEVKDDTELNASLFFFFITCISFVTFSITKLETRIQPSITLLLTTMVFKNTVNTFLPRYSYLTYMDKYILVSMLVMGLMCAWHAIANSVDLLWADKGVLIGLAAAYGIVNLVYVVVFIRARVRRTRCEQIEAAPRKTKKSASDKTGDGSTTKSSTPLTISQYTRYLSRINDANIVSINER